MAELTTTLAEVLAGACSTPTNVAVLVGDERVTFAQLTAAVAARRAALALKRTDVVLVTGTISLRWVIDYLAALADAGCVALHSSTSPLPAMAALEAVEANVMLGDKVLSADGPSPKWLPAFSATGSVVVFTSGTTGRPKAVLHTPMSLAWTVWNTQSITDEMVGAVRAVPVDQDALVADLVDRDGLGLVLRSGMGPDTIAGLSVLHRALVCGDTISLTERFDPTEFLSVGLGDHQVTTVGLSPHMARMVLTVARSGIRSQLIHVGLGGGPVPAELCEELAERLEVMTTPAYGTTETAGVLTSVRPGEQIRPGIGHVGRPVGAARIEARASADGAGPVLWCATPALMAGWIDQGALCAPPLDDGWFPLGDAGTVDDDGSVQVLGRADAVIHRAGRRLDPATIEAVLEDHPTVGRAVAFGVDGRVPGESDVAALVTLTGSVERGELRRWCADRLDTTFVPRRIAACDDLAVTADGAPRRVGLVAALNNGETL